MSKPTERCVMRPRSVAALKLIRYGALHKMSEAIDIGEVFGSMVEFPVLQKAQALYFSLAHALNTVVNLISPDGIAERFREKALVGQGVPAEVANLRTMLVRAENFEAVCPVPASIKWLERIKSRDPWTMQILEKWADDEETFQ